MEVTEKSYKNHQVFSGLERYSNFYENLAMSIFNFSTPGLKALHNIDTYVYSSIRGTIKSIRTILAAGQINDAYALLRKYYDSVIINVYSDLYLKDHISIDNFIVEKIDNWHQGKEKLPDYRIMSQYIKDSKKLKPLNDHLYSDDRYKRLRDRCNDHTHYNFFSHVLLNDSEVSLKNRIQWLNSFSRDVRDIFILHFAFVFFLNDHYLMSSDYIDHLECFMEPPQDSQHWVAPFAQEIFDEVIAKERPDIAAIIKLNTSMRLA